MICPICNKEIEEDVAFCKYCGHGFSTNNGPISLAESPRMENNKDAATSKGEKPKKIAKYALCSFFIFLLLFGLFFIYLYYPKYKYIKFSGLLDRGQLEEAAEYFVSNLANTQVEDEATLLCEDKVNQLYIAYKNEEVEYEKAVSDISVFRSINADIVDKTLTSIENLKQSHESYYSAEKLLASGDYKGAMGFYASVISEDTNYSDAISKVNSCYDSFLAEVIKEADEAVNNHEYSEALGIVNTARSDIKQDDLSMIDNKTESIINDYLSYIKDAVKEYESEEDYEGAIRYIDSIKESEIKEQMSILKVQIEDDYSSFFNSQIEILKEDKKIDEAMLLARKASALFPDNEEYSEAYTELTEYLPVRLQDIYLFESTLHATKTDEIRPVDKYQNEYEEGILYYSTSYQDVYDHYNFKETGEIYLLNKDYVRFTAVIAPGVDWIKDGNGEKSGRAEFTIYGDGVKLYSTSVWKDTYPAEINIDVTGIEKMEIAFLKGYQGYFLLAEPKLYKMY